MNNVLIEIADVLTREFSDLNDLKEIVQLCSRMLVAGLLGGILGFERESKGKAAGVRTHILVCVGAALFVFIPLQTGVSSADLTRVTQGIITGIGFLGAGSILKGNDEQHLKGLTTAAGIWLTAAIGIAVGMGHEATAILSTIFALIVLYILPNFSGANNTK